MFIHVANNGKQRQTNEHKNKSILLIFMDYQGKTENSLHRPVRILSPLRLPLPPPRR
jgi:hypothetical protein